jgi:hypothetical protein
VEHALLAGLGLAAPAGLNAYLPLLILALADRFSSAVTLDKPYDFLATNWGIAIITLLLTVEIVVDKVPGLDHANDLIQSAVRPAAGAILAMAATSDAASINPVAAMILGLVAAGSVHAAKATTRPAVTVSTGGIGNPLVSVAEDIVAAVSSIVAIFFPLLVGLFLIGFALFFLWAFRRLRRRRGPRLPNAVSTTLRR